jgi:hypothetical protein
MPIKTAAIPERIIPIKILIHGDIPYWTYRNDVAYAPIPKKAPWPKLICPEKPAITFHD